MGPPVRYGGPTALGGPTQSEHTLSTPSDPSSPQHTPGWSLHEPFSLVASLTDLYESAQRAAELARSDDGSAEHIAGVRLVRDVLRKIGARIEHHSAEWDC